jgi:hypothetical protein
MLQSGPTISVKLVIFYVYKLLSKGTIMSSNCWSEFLMVVKKQGFD